MARLNVGNGLTEYVGQLQKLGKDTEVYVGRAIYEGAAVVADAFADAIRGLPTSKDFTDLHKAGLLDGLGISKAQTDAGVRNVKIGIDGYNSIRTKKYPNGQPNSMIARSVDAGSSWRPAHPWITKATNRARKAAEEAMKNEIEKQIENEMK